MSDARYPLGAPINRPEPRAPGQPIPGRPGWIRDTRTGAERYVQPPRPKESTP